MPSELSNSTLSVLFPESVNPVTGERVFHKALIILSHPSFDMSKTLSYDAALVKLRIPKSILNQLM